MAKTIVKTGSNSKIRFIMLDADLPDGDLSQITSAISQALRYGQPGQRQLLAHVTSTAPSRAIIDNGVDTAAESEIEETDLEAPHPEPVTTSKPRAQRRFPTPKVVADVDLNSGDMSFEKFAKEKNPTATLGRYLLVAYWFKRYRNLDSINFNHVYTCFKKMGWGTDIPDFVQPLRDNARQGRGEMKRAHFTINHIGENVVEKMTAE
jgi:hypothetical protein